MTQYNTNLVCTCIHAYLPRSMSSVLNSEALFVLNWEGISLPLILPVL